MVVVVEDDLGDGYELVYLEAEELVDGGEAGLAGLLARRDAVDGEPRAASA
jgi:hypothetical protein